MMWPLSSFSISQGFSSSHPANDLAANTGTPILAPESGVVDGINNNAAGYFGGKYITMRGDSGYRYYMGHNSVNHISNGQRVSEGQHIADVGMTGQATGPHIHFQIWNSGGVLVDPSKIIEQGGNIMVRDSEDDYIRCKDLYLRIRGEELSRKGFKGLIGMDYKQVVDTFVNDKQSAVAQKWQSVGEWAVKGNWEKQIYDLKDAVIAKDKRIKELEATSGDFDMIYDGKVFKKKG